MALDEAKGYKEMIQSYQDKVGNRDEREKKNAKKPKGKAAESKPYQIWIFDARPKLTGAKGKVLLYALPIIHLPPTYAVPFDPREVLKLRRRAKQGQVKMTAWKTEVRI